MFTGEEITKIIAKAEKQERVIYVLFAASGLRAGELFGLEVKHFNEVTITVAQSVWESTLIEPPVAYWRENLSNKFDTSNCRQSEVMAKVVLAGKRAYRKSGVPVPRALASKIHSIAATGVTWALPSRHHTH